MPSERLVLRPPERGHKILIAEAGLRIPDDPIIPVIEGDGIGPEVVHAAARAIDAAIADTFGGRRTPGSPRGRAGGRARHPGGCRFRPGATEGLPPSGGVRTGATGAPR